jgi:hypothetical protein
VETNAAIAHHRKEVKEDAADAEVSKGHHVADCETGRCRDGVEEKRDRYSCDGV